MPRLSPAPLALLALCLALPAAADSEVRTREVLSQNYEVDRTYKSMQGPHGQEKVVLDDGLFPELLWIVGYGARMVGKDGETPLSQGQFSIRFPDGYGIPVLSTEELDLTTQVLNHNRTDGHFDVRHKVAIHYVRDSDLATPMRPLYPSSAFGMVLVKGDAGVPGVEKPHDETHGPGCLPGEAASNAPYDDELGRVFSGHWVVKPGREVNRTNVTQRMGLPFDTTLHYVAVHLHPFAESLTLRDLTTGEALFESHARGPEQGIGLEHVDHFSSKDGIQLHRDHQYELVSVYDNTSGEDQDSMAVMYLYLLDREYRAPAVLFGPTASSGSGS
jgi:hypothetical protein